MPFKLPLFFALLLALPLLTLAQEDDLNAPEPTPEEIELDIERRDYSQAEIKLLQELEQRKIELDRAQQALELRERLIDLAEQRLDDKIASMEKLQTRLEVLLKNLSEEEEKELARLAKIYEAMKPAAAATVMDRLDNAIIFDLFKRMKQKSTAKIMEKMNPPKARVISEMLAEKRDLPAFN